MNLITSFYDPPPPPPAARVIHVVVILNAITTVAFITYNQFGEGFHYIPN